MVAGSALSFGAGHLSEGDLSKLSLIGPVSLIGLSETSNLHLKVTCILQLIWGDVTVHRAIKSTGIMSLQNRRRKRKQKKGNYNYITKHGPLSTNTNQARAADQGKLVKESINDSEM